MESLRIDILNPKAKNLLTDLAALDLIAIREQPRQYSALEKLIEKLRDQAEPIPSLDEIASEVEAVRQSRHNTINHNSKSFTAVT